MRILKLGFWSISLVIVLTVACREPPHSPRSVARKATGKRIAIFKIVSHPAIDAMERGFRDAVLRDPTMASTRMYTYNANGNDATVALYADVIVHERYDAAFVLGTPCALKLKDKTKTMPIILGGATDPVGTKLVASDARPGENITGTTDLPPFGEHLRFLRAIVATANRVGVIYNQAEENSKLAVAALERAATAQDMRVIRIPVNAPADIGAAIAANANAMDVLCLPTDNMVQANIAPALTAATALNLPTFNCDVDSVKKGALFSVAVDYYDLGALSAKITRDILIGGRKPGDLPIQEIENPHIYVNRRVADRLRLTVPAKWPTPIHAVE